ncbi:MAG: DUF1836 domain-containing protein [Clostridia bacterium]|nr:DUF1836 domain-containing protein [Clostridia bacterium]
MTCTLPGTTLKTDWSSPQAADKVLSDIFAVKGLVLSQVSHLTGVEPYVIQNWVKRGFLSPPKHKLYSRRQFCRIVLINMLRESLHMEQIVSLLAYINGHLNDESDDIIDDTVLYDYFFRMLQGHLSPQTVTEDFQEPCPGARQRLTQVLTVMQTAYEAAQLQQKTAALLAGLFTDPAK